MQLFRYLKFGLAVILVFIGVKMLIEPWVVIPTLASLAVIGVVLATAVLASIFGPPRPARRN
jgi:tellurite resistance protein TerC